MNVHPQRLHRCHALNLRHVPGWYRFQSGFLGLGDHVVTGFHLVIEVFAVPVVTGPGLSDSRRRGRLCRHQRAGQTESDSAQ